MYDLLLKGGEILDLSQELRAVGDVAFEGGRIARVGGEISPDDARDVIDVTKKLVTPGLIDLHGHYAYLNMVTRTTSSIVRERSGTNQGQHIERESSLIRRASYVINRYRLREQL